MAHKILNNISTVTGIPLQVGASVGVAFYSDHRTTLDELIKNADTASRFAK